MSTEIFKPTRDWFLAHCPNEVAVEVHEVDGCKVHLFQESENTLNDCGGLWTYRIEFPDEADDALSNWFDDKESCLTGAKGRIEEIRAGEEE